MTTTTRFGILVAMVVLAACGQEARLQALQVTPPVTEVTEHLRANVTAIAVYSDGTQRDVTAEVQWTSQDAAVASAEAGVVQAGQPGSTYLTAAWSGLETSARVDVVAATLLALQVTTDAATLPAGLTARASASGTFSDGSTRDVTASVQWSASGGAVTVDAAGTVRAVLPGLVDVVATLDGATAAAPVEVTEAQAVSLELRNVAAALPLGLTAAFQVVATFTDGTVRDVTAEAALEVADAAIATVDGSGTLRVLAAGAKELRGLAAGTTELRAAYAGLAAAAPVEITAAVLVAIEVSAPHGAIKQGNIYYFSAAGTFSDGAVTDLTAALTWTSSDQGVARVYDFIAPSAILAFAEGTATISAIDPVSQVTGTYQLTVAK